MLVGVTFVVFAYLLSCDFTSWDDQTFILRNPLIANPSFENAIHYWRSGFFTIYIPLTATAWVALAAIGRSAMPGPSGTVLNPTVFHAANLLIHIVSGLLVFEIIRRLVKSTWPALVGALVFAIHPVQVETVGWVSGLKDLLAGCLTFGAIAAYLTSAESSADSKRPARWYAMATGLFVLGMLAKPSAMLTGGLVFVIDAALLRRPLKQVALWSGPWLILGAVVAIVARLMQPVIELGDRPAIWTRPLIVGHSLAFYLGKIVWPVSLTVDYGQNPPTVLSTAWAYWAWLVPIALIAVAFALRKSSRLPLVGVALFILAPFHTLGWVPFDFQTYSTTADHYLYVAMLGIGLIAAWGVSRVNNRTMNVVVVAVLLALGIRSVTQTFTWQNTETLFNHALHVNPKSWAAYTSLAVEAKEHGDFQAAFEQAGKAIAIRPQDPLAYLVRGSVYAATGDFKNAIATYRHAAELNPNDAGTLTNLGGALAAVGNTTEAAPILRRAVSIDPYNAQAHLNLGTLLFQRGDAAGAEPLLGRAAALSPLDAQAHMNHGIVLMALGRRVEATAELQAAYRLRPDLPNVRETLQELNSP